MGWPRRIEGHNRAGKVSRHYGERRALIVCDCEGCELELLRPDLVAGLRRCDLLAELHDFVDRSISATLRARFAATHDITLVNSVARDPAAYPRLNPLGRDDRLVAVAEGRPETMRWAFMTARDLSTETADHAA